MDQLQDILARARTDEYAPTPEELRYLLALESDEDLRRLYAAAYEVKLRHIGKLVSLRGLIEVSNICDKNCYYCGIRKDNRDVKRFRMSKDEIIREAQWIFENRYGSLVLQSGEICTPEYVAFIETAVKEIKEFSSGRLGITLCLGEQSEETYRRWFDAGAHRYLLRIETSAPELYKEMHPADHDFYARLKCLRTLQKIGYQTGTGVMIGLPGQTVDHLVKDLQFFHSLDIDMIGMGPYIVHHQTPLAAKAAEFDGKIQLKLGLKMVAAARLLLKDINIAATTALQALDPKGREMGLMAGANVIMPNVTDVQYRPSYQLYDNKPCLDENSTQCRHCLERRIASAGEEILWEDWGDSKHFFRRTGKTPAE